MFVAEKVLLLLVISLTDKDPHDSKHAKRENGSSVYSFLGTEA